MTVTSINLDPEQYLAAVEAAEIGVWEFDLLTGSVIISNTCRKHFGFKSQDLVTCSELELRIHPDDVTSYRQRVRQSLDPELRKPYDDEYRIVDIKTGAVIRWVRSKGKAIFGDDEKPLRFTGILTDITHRKAVEQKLEQSRNEFHLLADSLPQVVWTAQPNGHVDYWNHRWYELTGNIGEGDESWMPVVHPDDAVKVMEVWQYSLQTGVPYRIECRVFDQRLREYRWYLGMAFPVRNKEGEIVKWFGTNTEIHDQKLLTSFLEQKVAERTAQLERSNQELEQFAYIASHDLQEPLRKIRTFVSMIEEKSDALTPEQMQAYLERIKSSSVRMSNLITDLLNLSRTTQEDGCWQKVNLNEIVQQVCEDLELMVGQKAAIIKADPLPEINGIPLQLSQLFYNLIQNSLKFERPGVPPEVYIQGHVLAPGELQFRFPALDVSRQYVCIQVVDNGIGFDPQHAEKIFVMFQRLQGKNAYEGTGIGLALCKKVVENHKGHIEATSVPGHGTTFTLLLPLSA